MSLPTRKALVATIAALNATISRLTSERRCETEAFQAQHRVAVKAEREAETLRARLRDVLAELDGIAHNYRAAVVQHRRELNMLALHLVRATNAVEHVGLEPDSLIYAYRSPVTEAARRALGDLSDPDPRGSPRPTGVGAFRDDMSAASAAAVAAGVAAAIGGIPF